MPYLSLHLIFPGIAQSGVASENFDRSNIKVSSHISYGFLFVCYFFTDTKV